MSQALKDFRELLAQLFQTEDSNLDFGIYRVLKQERHHIDRFLDKRLERIVRETLGAADDSQRASLQSELDTKIKQRRDDSYSDEEIEKAKPIRDLREQLANLQTSDSLETEVYNGLYDFFGRYYDDGDFLARPRYKRDVYALPYNGEEVKLHWANRDQYYIKSARVLDEFSFEINGQKICFQIRPSESGDGDNNKETRKFVLARDENDAPLVENQNGVLKVHFDFKKDGKNTDALGVEAAQSLAALPEFSFATEDALRTKLRSWTKRKDWDFFVHKNLESFLKRELDFYLKNEVLALDGLLAGDSEKWEKTTLNKAKAMHRLGGHIIKFLAQLETLQKRLWEKQKWVTKSRIVIPFGKVPQSLCAEVLSNTAQIEEWMALYGVETEAISTVNAVVWTNPPSAEWANNHPDISVDSANFDESWTRRLWSELSKTATLDELWNGIVFNADNFAALNLMQSRFQEAVKCIHIDPPYNSPYAVGLW